MQVEASAKPKMKTKEYLFKQLMTAYSEAFSKKSKQQIQLDVVNVWKNFKKSSNIEQLVEEKVSQWKKVSLDNKTKLMSMWSKVNKIVLLTPHI